MRREYNAAADELAKLVASRVPTPPGVFVDDQHQLSVDFGEEAGPTIGPMPGPWSGDRPAPDVARIVAIIASDPGGDFDPDDMPDPDAGTAPNEGGKLYDLLEAEGHEDWRIPFLEWLTDGKLPPDQTEARRLARRAKSYKIIDQELYRRGHNSVLQRCILVEEGRSLLKDIHGGVRGHHAAPRTIVGSAFREGFYWPTAVAYAEQIVRTCDGCQFYARQTHLPA